MSDCPPRKIRRTMKRIPICGNDWLEIFELMHHRQLGLEIALLSDIFDYRVDEHFKKRKWTLGELWIRQETDQSDAIIFNYNTEKYLPLPDGPLPDNVVGFERINIYYINHDVIDFLRRIRRLFQPKKNGNDGIVLHLGIRSYEVRSCAVFCNSIWPLINPSAITKLYFHCNSFGTFCRRISPTFLRDLANARVIDVQFDFPFGRGENGQLLCEWLLIPRADGKPKLLKNCYLDSNELVEQLKTAFLRGQTAVSFIVAMKFNGGAAVPFELDNLLTGEHLAFRKVGNYKWLLERGPIGGRNVEKWAKWEREAMEEKLKDHNNLLLIWLNDNQIGPLDDEIAGPSGSGQQLQQK